MSGHRFFVSPENSTDFQVGEVVSLQLDPQAFHHATRVLRLRQGERIETVLRDVWTTYQCEIIKFSKDSILAHVIEEISTTELPVKFDLFWGYAKGDKNERIVRQAVEVGCARLVPVQFVRCDVRFDKDRAEKKQVRLQAIAESAAMQAHRSIIPTVEQVQSFDSLVDSLSEYDASIVAWEQAQGPSLSQVVDEALRTEPKRVALIIGPEGGIERSEIDMLIECDVRLSGMGDSILRVETACVVACGILADRIRTYNLS